MQKLKELNPHSKWLFPSARADKPIRGESIDHAIRRSKFLGVAHWTPHDLRRTAASQMTAMGISRLVVSKILNHIESSVTAAIPMMQKRKWL